MALSRDRKKLDTKGGGGGGGGWLGNELLSRCIPRTFLYRELLLYLYMSPLYVVCKREQVGIVCLCLRMYVPDQSWKIRGYYEVLGKDLFFEGKVELLILLNFSYHVGS